MKITVVCNSYSNTRIHNNRGRKEEKHSLQEEISHPSKVPHVANLIQTSKLIIPFRTSNNTKQNNNKNNNKEKTDNDTTWKRIILLLFCLIIQ